MIVVKLSPRVELDRQNKKMAIKKPSLLYDDVNLHKLLAASRLGRAWRAWRAGRVYIRTPEQFIDICIIL